MVSIRQQLVSPVRKAYTGTNPTNFITIHETANTSPGANAAAHANLQSKGNSRSASWHYQVDDHEAVQSYAHTVQCWHSGKGRDPGNLQSIAIEICVNSDGNFAAAVDNAAQLTAKLMHDEGVTIAGVVQHNHWSGKNCPTYLRNGSKGISWNDFLNKVAAYASGGVPGPTPTPTPPVSGGDVAVDGVWGSGTTKELQLTIGTPADGEVWGQYGPNAQPGCTTGWKYVEKNPQGSTIILELQKRLQAIGLYGGKLDGIAGPVFWRAFQTHEGTVADGEIWKPSPAVKEMQRRLNLNNGSW